MPSLNKVQLIGYLGADPEIRYTGSGTAVANIRLATDEGYKDASGQKVDKTEWHNVVAWDRLAEICGEYLQKGSLVYFEGSLQTRKWEDREGNERYTTETRAFRMQMLDSKKDGQQSKPKKSKPKAQKQQEDWDAPDSDDDLPF